MSNDTPIALVTGAARRIGAKIAEGLHQAGYGVVVHYRDSTNEALALAGRLNDARRDSAWPVQGNLDSLNACKALAGEALACADRIDVLVNNASRFFPTPVGRVSETDWDALFDSNLKAPFFLTQALAPALAARGGCVVNLTDVHAQRPLPGYAPYSAAKAGLVTMTKALARELGPATRVNAVAPGTILWPEADQNAGLSCEEIIQRTALKRKGTPEDIAQAVLYLVRAPYVTGQVLTVDGGRSL